jgi:hypothetical protein
VSLNDHLNEDFWQHFALSIAADVGKSLRLVTIGRIRIFPATDKFSANFFELLIPVSFGLSRSQQNRARLTAIPKLK